MELPKELTYAAAMKRSRRACGSDVRFFPNERTMITIWHIHAAVIFSAMRAAYRLGIMRGRNLTPAATDTCPDCGGDGADKDMMHYHLECPTCHNTGQVPLS